ncbi:MAG: hypothetical protein IT458_02440 [Planctomycetes bacterium]|nr:hypothetical protein [Planctomycetota bacterium]
MLDRSFGVVSLCLAALALDTLSAQVAWTQANPTVAPGARSLHGMAYDLQRARMVLFGGYTTASGQSNDTWEWDGAAWAQRPTPTSPQARSEHQLCYDFVRGRTVLFAGWNGFSYYGDTWEYDGTTWTQAQPSGSPPPRSHYAMAYDFARLRVVLYGGWDWRVGQLGDTWEYDGAAWTQKTPPQSPGPRADHAMAFDTLRGRMVLFGGSGAAGALGDTWEYDGTTWTQVASTGIPARRHHSMAFDPVLGRVVLFGGDNAAGILDETWEWDGTTWRQRTLAPRPPARNDHAMVFDAVQGRTLLFGGATPQGALGDTWTYAVAAPATFSTYLAGCMGTQGVPRLGADPGMRPWIGERFVLHIDNLPASGPASLLMGASRTQWGGLTLPFDLTFLGMPSCFLLASGELAFGLVVQRGSANWGLDLPNDTGIVGFRLFQQAIVIDPGANRFGVTVSNGGASVVGAR